MKSHLLALIAGGLGCLLFAEFGADRAAQAGLPRAKSAYVATDALASPYATQAAATDETFVYAVADNEVAKYDRATGKGLARSTGKAQHLNSGFLWKGKLYCAHSNYPTKPHQSDLRVLDPKTMQLTIYHAFQDPPGSLTWAVRKGDSWWCHFAHYGTDNHKSVLVKYDAGWKEIRRWAYPKELVADWGAFSLSGGIWHEDELLATGHDKKLIYRLNVPKEGNLVELVEVIPAPFPGQGIASDPKTGGLVGIDRANKQVVFAKLKSK